MTRRHAHNRIAVAVVCITAILFVLRISAFAPRVSALSDPCALDPSNLVTNGSMAGGYSTVYGTVVVGWTPFVLTNIAPHFEHVDNEQIDPNGSQYIWQDDQPFDAGIYQTVTGLNPGALYRIWLGYALAANDPRIGQNLRTNRIGRQIGIDLTGGVDPLSANIVWSPVFYNGIAALNIPALSMSFRAQSDRMTVFLRAINTDSFGRNKVWFDSVCMEPTMTAPTPTAALPTLSSTGMSLPQLTPEGTPIYFPMIARQCPVSNIGTADVGWHPRGVTADPAGNRVYVSLDDASSVTFVDGYTSTSVQTWWLGDWGGGSGIGVDAGRVFAALQNSGRLSVLDASTGGLPALKGVGAQPFGVGASGGRVWVANSASDSMTVLDTVGNQVATVSLPGSPQLVSADGDRAFAAIWENGVAEVSSTGAPLYNYGTTGAGSFGVAFDRANNVVYVGNRSTRQILKMDAGTGQLLSSALLEQAPYAMALNPWSGHLFAVLAETNQVDVRDAANLDPVAVLPVGNQSTNGGVGIAVMNGRAYISNYADGTLSILKDDCK